GPAEDRGDQGKAEADFRLDPSRQAQRPVQQEEHGEQGRQEVEGEVTFRGERLIGVGNLAVHGPGQPAEGGVENFGGLGRYINPDNPGYGHGRFKSSPGMPLSAWGCGFIMMGYFVSSRRRPRQRKGNAMSIDKSLRRKDTLQRARNVLTRGER